MINESIELTGALPAGAKKLVSHAEILACVSRLAREINAQEAIESMVVLCVMSGGMVFCGHLLTELTHKVTLDYVHVSRYGGNLSGGNLTWKSRPSTSLRGKVVLIVDDLVDQGYTLRCIDDACRSLGAKVVKSAVLLKKRVQATYNPHFVGFEVENDYIFGFGIDYARNYRNLPDIYTVKL